MSSDRLPDIILPEPSRTARIMMTLRAVGILLAGVGVFVLSLIGRSLVDQAHDNTQQAKCRAEIVDELTGVESQINATGWTAMLALFRDDDAAISLHAEALTHLLDDLPELRDRANHRFEICS